jgi:CubicO group peptidase (beta-lactamase class C family)
MRHFGFALGQGIPQGTTMFVRRAYVRRIGTILSTFLLIGSVQSFAADWAENVKIQPRQPGSTPEPGRDLDIQYPCKLWSTCELADFTERLDVCALFVMHGGKPVLHRVEPENGTDQKCKDKVARERYGIASITKSITSLLAGYAFNDPSFGAPIDIQSKAKDALHKLGIRYQNEDVTLRDLLQMSSGMGWDEKAEKNVIRIEKNPDGTQRGPHRSFEEAVAWRLKKEGPWENGGAQGDFRYSGFDSVLIGMLVADRMKAGAQTQQPILAEALKTYFWHKLGMQKKSNWKSDFDFQQAAYCCLYTSAGDLALLGDWVLQQYRHGTGVVAKWIRRSVADKRLSDWHCRYKSFKQDLHYGYQWWVLSGPGNSFTGIGANGQFLHLFPEQNVVVVQLSHDEDRTSDDVCEALMVHRLIADKLASN